MCETHVKVERLTDTTSVSDVEDASQHWELCKSRSRVM